MKSVLLFLACLLSLTQMIYAEPNETETAPETSAPQETLDQQPKLEWVTGRVELGKSGAVLNLGDQYRFVGKEGARTILVDIWGNPPESAAGIIGMVFPANVELDAAESWGATLQFLEEGYIEDDEASDIDYEEMLADMKKSTSEGNAERKAAGYGSVELVGWAESPRYDKSSHKLYWAKELAFEGSETNTLNYDVRILGRKGVLEISAIAGIGQLHQVKPGMEELLKATEFEATHRYEDFLPGADKVAAYGIGGLIAGKLAMKAGLFAVILKLLAGSGKFLVLGAVAALASLKSLFRRGKKEGAEA